MIKFLKVIELVIIVLTLDIPMSVLLTSCTTSPISTILGMIWGFGVGIVAYKLVFRGDV